MGSQLYIEIDEDKKLRLKVLGIQNNISIKDIINLAVDDYINNNGKPKWAKKS